MLFSFSGLRVLKWNVIVHRLKHIQYIYCLHCVHICCDYGSWGIPVWLGGNFRIILQWI